MTHPEIQTNIQSQWLGRMQQEIGVLQTNVMLLNLQQDALRAQTHADAQLIEALKARCQNAEQANAELREQLRPRMPSQTGGVKRVKNATQPT